MAVSSTGPAAGHRPLVLVGFGESLAAIESSWLLLDAGFRVTAFVRDAARTPLARDTRIAVHRIVAPETGVDAAADDLRRLVCRLEPAAVLPLDDAAVWLCDRVWREPGLPPLAGPSGELADLALDKARQIALARRAGFPIPPTVVVRAGAELAVPVPETPGPWIAKPALAARVETGRLVRGRPVRLGTVEQARTLAARTDQPMLVQPVLRGTGEGVFGHAGSDGVTGWSAHRRIRMMHPDGSGSSACRSIAVDPAVLASATTFVDRARWRGPFMLELLRDERGTPWWMELNGRAWGSMALARRRGLPYPVWAVRAALDAAYAPVEPPPAPPVVVRHLGREIVHLAAVLRGPPAGTSGWPTRTATVREVVRWHRGDRLYNARRGQARVLASDTWQTVRAVVRASRQR